MDQWLFSKSGRDGAKFLIDFHISKLSTTSRGFVVLEVDPGFESLQLKVIKTKLPESLVLDPVNSYVGQEYHITVKTE